MLTMTSQVRVIVRQYDADMVEIEQYAREARHPETCNIDDIVRLTVRGTLYTQRRHTTAFAEVEMYEMGSGERVFALYAVDMLGHLCRDGLLRGAWCEQI